MNNLLNEYAGFCLELNFELNHFWAKFNEKMNFQNVSNRAKVNVRTITSIFQDGNIITVHRWLIFMYLHHFISTDAAVTIDIIEVKRPDNLRRKILKSFL